jgi:hypothetical protein
MPDSLTGKLCPNCGSPDIHPEDGTIRCDSCGSALRWAAGGAELVIVALAARCPACGEPGEKGMAYCRGCGTLVAEPCPRCGERNPVQAAYCGACRYPLDAPPEECPRCGHVQPTGDDRCERCELVLDAEPALEVSAPDRLTLGPFRASPELRAQGDGHVWRIVLVGCRRWLGLLPASTEATITLRNTGGRMLRVQIQVPKGFAAPGVVSLAGGEESRVTIRPEPSDAVKWKRRKGTVQALGGKFSGEVVLRSNGGDLRVPVTMRVRKSEPISEAEQAALWGWWWRSVENPKTPRASALVRIVKGVLILLIVGLIIGWAAVLVPSLMG